jgi:hypothetical protein
MVDLLDVTTRRTHTILVHTEIEEIKFISVGRLICWWTEVHAAYPMTLSFEAFN